MAWFDRLRGGLDPVEAGRRLQTVVDRSKITPALGAAAGPHGLRRFIVRFDLKAGRPRVVGMDAAQIPRGGGPPNAAAFDAGIVAVEASLQSLRMHMPPPFSFERGAVGFIRDGSGAVHLSFRFDEDIEGFTAADLAEPKGDPHVLEDPAYLRSVAAWESRAAQVRARWVRPRPEESWSLDGGTLRIEGPDGPRSFAVDPLAVHEGSTFRWLVARPVASEAPFAAPEVETELLGAMELAVFAAARLGRPALFSAATEDGATLFAAMRE